MGCPLTCVLPPLPCCVLTSALPAPLTVCPAGPRICLTLFTRHPHPLPPAPAAASPAPAALPQADPQPCLAFCTLTLPSAPLHCSLPAHRMTQIARERFPDLFPGEESLAAMASRVLVFTPRTSQQLLQTLQARAACSHCLPA